MVLLKVNEIFGLTIQGEGKTSGKPVMFLRLGMCNLQCVWCDTPYTWNWTGTDFKHNDSQKYDKVKEIREMTPERIRDLLIYKQIEQKGLDNLVRAVVVSGGEPLIQHKQLTSLFELLKLEDWWIEVETNGTILPNNRFLELVDQINCSPKLANSGMKQQKRERPEVLQALASNPKVNFKFVVSCEDDLPEIISLIKKYQMKEVYLMPLGMTKKELEITRNLTREIAEKTGLLFSDRKHITLLGGGRGI